MNIPVFIQHPHRPNTRHQVGYIAAGKKPKSRDYRVWDIDEDAIVGEKEMMSHGQRIRIIVVLP